MTFPGIPDEMTRANIIAFLKQTAESGTAQEQMTTPQGGAGGMGGMGMSRGPATLKTVDASARVKAISYCNDTFKVTTEDGKSRDFWERNLRFKTDSSDDGPNKGAPAIVAAGMMGDRASVIFSSPEEMTQFVARHC
jgi:cytochrome c